MSYLWYGTRFSADLIYGSGLRSGFANTDHLPSYAQVNTGVSHEFDIPGWAPVTLRFDVVNVFDTSYVIRNGTGIGVFSNQFGPRRGYYFGLAQKFGPGAAAKKPAAATPRVSMTRGESAWTWTGFYIGGNVGYSASRFNTDTSFNASGVSAFATTTSTRHYGALGGGQSGYNWQLGMWLAGIETDIDFAHQRITTDPACPGTICNSAIPTFDAPVSLIHQHNLDWFGTLRGRLGVAITPDVLAYGTGGLAYGEIEHTGLIYGSDGVTPGDVPNVFTNRALRAGWTAGGGIEVRLAGNVTGRIEYLHMDFGFDKAQAILSQNATPIAVNFNSRITEDIVRLGINYKLDPNAEAPVYQPARSAPVDKPRMILTGPVKGLWTWTGYYLGINAGYGWGKSNTDAFFNDNAIPASFATSSTFALKGEVFGVQTGYNFQSGKWVWGIEADAQLSGQRDNPKLVCPGTICNPAGAVIASFDQDQVVEWFGTLRARFGAAVTTDALVYATGGAAVAGLVTAGNVFGYDPDGNPATNPFRNITINGGWTAGGGVEARLCGNWTGKIEYLYINLASMTSNVNNQQIMALTAGFNSRITDKLVRAGINYKFD